jgi:signal transduction histidine kinase
MPTSKTYFVCLALLLSWVLAIGQTNVDSLEQKLQSTQGYERVDLLNQLTYEFITRDNAKAMSYNGKALALSDELGYKKGKAVAYTYKGVYEYLSGQFPAAHDDLHRGLRLSREARDRVNEGYTLLQLGNCGLEEVENDSALLYFNKAYVILKDSTNPATLSKLYRNMSAVYGQRYQYDSQRYYLDRAIEIRRLLPDRVLLTEGLVLKANNAFRAGERNAAEAIITEAEKLIGNDPAGDEQRSDLRHLRALILFQKGKFEEAKVLVDSARDYYFKVSLFRKYVTLLMDIGKIFADQGEYEIALTNLYAALKLSKLRGFDSETFAIRNRIGWINFQLGDYQQCLRLANEALNGKPNRQLRGDEANALTLKGSALGEMKKYEESKAAFDLALRIYKRLKDPHGISESLMNLASITRQQGKFELAFRLYHEAIALAETYNYDYGVAYSGWGLAEIYFRQSDFRNAELYLGQAESYAKRIRANEVLILCYNTRRDLLAAQSRHRESLEYSMMASQLSDSLHRKDLVRRFVNLERMDAIEQRDRDIKLLQQEKQLAEHKINLQESKLKQQFILIIGGVISLALLAFLAFVYYRFYWRIKLLNVTITEKNKRIQAQADKLQEVNLELSQIYKEVSEQNEEIQSQSARLSESHQRISELNRSLEGIVLEKTVELRKTNEELVKYNHELLQFSYTVSHNLRGPVARLLGLSELAQAEQELDKGKEWIKLISRTAGDLDLIIKDLSKLLDLRNEPNQYRENVNFQQEWNRSLSLLQESLTGDEIILSDFTSYPELVTVRAMVQSIFYNLLSNAIKFRSPDRPLRVVAKSSVMDDNLIIEVTDNGLGFDTEQHKERIFKLYKRFHTHVAGRGLGLYLVKAQLEVLNGTINVQSRLHHGTVFRVNIPLAHESELSRVG